MKEYLRFLVIKGTIDISGTKHDYYLKDSEASEEVLKKMKTTRKELLWKT